MKDQLDHKIQLCEDAMKNLDLNTRLQSKKRCKNPPWSGKQLKFTDWTTFKTTEGRYRESVYQPSMGYCGVFAIAYYTGIRFDIVFDYMRSRFNRGGTWAGATHLDEVQKTLDHFGFKMQKLPISKADNITVKNIDKNTFYPNEWIWIHTQKHWWLYNNGFAIDQGETAPVAQHNRKNKIVLDAYRIIAPKSDKADYTNEIKRLSKRKGK